MVADGSIIDEQTNEYIPKMNHPSGENAFVQALFPRY
jgi:hypothetical protein